MHNMNAFKLMKRIKQLSKQVLYNLNFSHKHSTDVCTNEINSSKMNIMNEMFSLNYTSAKIAKKWLE